VWIPIAAALVPATVLSFGSLLGFPLAMLGLLVVCGWLIAMLAAAGLAAWRRAWRRLASLVAILVCAVPATAVSMVAGDHIHLLLMLPAYASAIAAAPPGSGPIRFHRPALFSYERTLVYDPADELVSQVGSAQLPRTVWHLAGHFYVLEIDFAQ
jgi:hypothetical protein